MKLKLAEVQNQTFIDKNDITLIQVIMQFVDQLKNANKIKQVTYNRYMQTIKIIEKMPISDKPIQQITLNDINSNLTILINDYANSTITKVYGVIKQGYNYAMLHEYIVKSPFLIKGAVIKPNSVKTDKTINALTYDEQIALVKELKKSNDKYKDIIYIALYSGMRVGEILALSPSDIYNNTIHVQRTLTRNEEDKYIIGDTTKTYSGMRDVPILADLEPIISNLSFDTLKTIPNVINAHFKRICKNAGIRIIEVNSSKRNKQGNIIKIKSSDVNTHMLRHTFATRCIEAGMNPVVLQKILGHKNIEITLNTYTSVFDRYKQDEIGKVNKYLSGLH